MKLTLVEVQEGIREMLHANCYFDRGDSSITNWTGHPRHNSLSQLHALQNGGPPPPLIIYPESRWQDFQSSCRLCPPSRRNSPPPPDQRYRITRITSLPEPKTLDYVVLIREKSNPDILPHSGHDDIRVIFLTNDQGE